MEVGELQVREEYHFATVLDVAVVVALVVVVVVGLVVVVGKLVGHCCSHLATSVLVPVHVVLRELRVPHL